MTKKIPLWIWAIGIGCGMCRPVFGSQPETDSLRLTVKRFGNTRSPDALQARLRYAIRLARKDARASDSLVRLLESYPESKKSPEFWARVLSIRADLKEEAGERLAATALYQKVYHIGDSLHADEIKKLALTGLGSVEIPRGNIRRGMAYCRRAIEISLKTIPLNHGELAKLYYNIGLAQGYLENPDSARF